MDLWNQTPGLCETVPAITPYLPAERKFSGAVVVFAGGAYSGLAAHEGPAYAEFLQKNGIAAFNVDYRVAPHRFPLELLDARRGVRVVRANAAEYGIDPQKILVMGSSAGGHLAALVSTFTDPIPEEQTDAIDRADCRPNGTILCYPVIVRPELEGISHRGSYKNLLGGEDPAMERKLDPSLLVNETTPPAFIWHTSDDQGVNVINSYLYATALRRAGVPAEMHIFPHGRHGLGLAQDAPHVAQWAPLLLNWLRQFDEGNI